MAPPWPQKSSSNTRSSAIAAAHLDGRTRHLAATPPQSRTESSTMKARSAALVHCGGVRPDRGLNIIPVGDREFLLTVTAGDAVHLSREAGRDETARGAVPGWHLRRARVSSRVRWHGYNRATLAEPRWAETHTMRAAMDRHGWR